MERLCGGAQTDAEVWRRGLWLMCLHSRQQRCSSETSIIDPNSWTQDETVLEETERIVLTATINTEESIGLFYMSSNAELVKTKYIKIYLLFTHLHDKHINLQM